MSWSSIVNIITTKVVLEAGIELIVISVDCDFDPDMLKLDIGNAAFTYFVIQNLLDYVRFCGYFLVEYITLG